MRLRVGLSSAALTFIITLPAKLFPSALRSMEGIGSKVSSLQAILYDSSSTLSQRQMWLTTDVEGWLTILSAGKIRPPYII